MTEYINYRGPRINEKPTEAKILSHTKKITRFQKGDRNMKHRKGDTASGVSSNRSNIARAMRVRMLKVLPNLVPPETSFQTEANPVPQIAASKVIIAPPTTNTFTELTLPSTSAPLEALHQFLPQTTKRKRKVQNIMDLKMTIHPANRQIRAHLISHSPAGNVVLAMSNQTLCIPNNR